jgi:hypothetical protein
MQDEIDFLSATWNELLLTQLRGGKINENR